jgi:hypothetical protein
MCCEILGIRYILIAFVFFFYLCFDDTNTYTGNKGWLGGANNSWYSIIICSFPILKLGFLCSLTNVRKMGLQACLKCNKVPAPCSIFGVRQDLPSVIRWDGQAVSGQLRTLNEALVQPTPVFVGSFVDNVYLYSLCRVLQYSCFPFVNVISSLLHSHFYSHPSDTKSTNLESYKKQTTFGDQVHWIEK